MLFLGGGVTGRGVLLILSSLGGLPHTLIKQHPPCMFPNDRFSQTLPQYQPCLSFPSKGQEVWWVCKAISVLFDLPAPSSGSCPAHLCFSATSFPAPRATSLLLVPPHSRKLTGSRYAAVSTPSFRPTTGRGVPARRGSGARTGGAQDPVLHLLAELIDAYAPTATGKGVGDRLPGDQAGCGLGPGPRLALGTQSVRCQLSL